MEKVHNFHFKIFCYKISAFKKFLLKNCWEHIQECCYKTLIS